ncbi:MAG: hypothetical protein Q8R28_14870, partial [Dehalococcoidia bacterium]|nr:hypothetical protein [Dehalococcoidia bacterium]
MINNHDCLPASVSSDWHCQPDVLKDCVRYWIRRGKAGNMRLVGAGDCFDLIPLGWHQWILPPALLQLAGELDGYPLKLVEGNHDPYLWLKEVVAPWSNISVLHELNILDPVNQHAYRISHGSSWSLDWGYLGLNSVAPRLVEWMVRHHPIAWYAFCKSRNWLASLDPPQG